MKVAKRPGFALFDTGSMANVMAKHNADRLGLPIKPLGNVSAVSFGGQHTRLHGCLQDVAIDVNGVSVRSNIYVVENLDPAYDLILGMPFMSATRAASWHDENDEIHLKFRDPATNHEVEILATTSDGIGAMDDDEEDRQEWDGLKE